MFFFDVPFEPLKNTNYNNSNSSHFTSLNVESGLFHSIVMNSLNSQNKTDSFKLTDRKIYSSSFNSTTPKHCLIRVEGFFYYILEWFVLLSS
jgi:hypothetical protein